MTVVCIIAVIHGRCDDFPGDHIVRDILIQRRGREHQTRRDFGPVGFDSVGPTCSEQPRNGRRLDASAILIGYPADRNRR